MKRPAIFFDRDNTLIVNDGYLGDPDGVKLVDGAADAVARARRLGFATVVCSNQSGVARGMFDETAVGAVNRRMDEMLTDANPGAILDRHEYCPFHPEASVESYRQDSDLRKPKAGMILRAAQALELDLGESWVIGDAPRDIEAGRAAGCRTILVKDGSFTASPAANEASDATADHVVPNLAEAIAVIETEVTGGAPPVGRESARPEKIVETIAAPSKPAVTVEPTGVVNESESIPLAQMAATSDASSAAGGRVEAGIGARKKSDPTSDKSAAAASRSRQEILTEQILDELRRRNDGPIADFSISKLFAGIVQVLAVAFMIVGYLYPNGRTHLFLVAIFLQTMTISLLIMGKQK